MKSGKIKITTARKNMGAINQCDWETPIPHELLSSGTPAAPGACNARGLLGREGLRPPWKN
jgi:hypothetical protein